METETDSAKVGASWARVMINLKRSFSHLDAVRTISFHPNELSIATGGDDNTIKLWRVDPPSLTSTACVSLNKFWHQVLILA